MKPVTAADYKDETSARKVFESLRWPDGPVCSHCGTVNHAYETNRPGVYRCAEKLCRKDFTVMTGTVMERSHIPIHKWLEAFSIMCESKKGVSSLQLQRHLKISYKAAWFLSHRIREAMRDGGLTTPPMLGGGGKIVEADETYFGRHDQPVTLKKPRSVPYTKGGWKDKGKTRAIVSLVERGGNVRSFHVAHADKDTVGGIVASNILRETRLHTDESRLYSEIGGTFGAHETVKHSAGEYVRDDVHTNSVEGYFSIFKRGMKGVYQHCREKHLHRYLAEFDFRYNHRIKLGFNDGARAAIAVKGIEGKRLTYRQPH